MLPDANVISQTRIAAAAAGSFSTPKIVVYARKDATCEPPPTPGNCSADPASVNAVSSKQSPTLSSASFPPNPCDTYRYTITTKYQCTADKNTASAKSRGDRIV